MGAENAKLVAARRRVAEAEAKAAAAEAAADAEEALYADVDLVEAFPEFFPQYQQ